MSEILRFIPEQIRTEAQASEKFARLLSRAQLIYFTNETRNEKNEQFEIFDGVIPAQTLRETTAFVNKKIHEGHDIVILDFPDDDKIRMQGLNENFYTNKYTPRARPFLKPQTIKGNFSTRLRNFNSEENEGLSIDVRDEHGSVSVNRVSWDLTKKPDRRFAVMSVKDNRWDVILDFRIDKSEGMPAWKVNSKVHSRN